MTDIINLLGEFDIIRTIKRSSTSNLKSQPKRLSTSEIIYIDDDSDSTPHVSHEHYKAPAPESAIITSEIMMISVPASSKSINNATTQTSLEISPYIIPRTSTTSVASSYFKKAMQEPPARDLSISLKRPLPSCYSPPKKIPVIAPPPPSTTAPFVTLKDILYNHFKAQDAIRLQKSNTPILISSAPAYLNDPATVSVTTPILTSIQPFSSLVAPSKLSNMIATHSSTAPISSSTAPISSSTAPISSSTAPISSSTASISSNTVLISSSTAPISSSTAPISSNTVLISSSTAPISSNTAPISSSTDPIINSIVLITEDTIPIIENTVPISKTTSISEIVTTPTSTLSNIQKLSLFASMYQKYVSTNQQKNSRNPDDDNLEFDVPSSFEPELLDYNPSKSSIPESEPDPEFDDTEYATNNIQEQTKTKSLTPMQLKMLKARNKRKLKTDHDITLELNTESSSNNAEDAFRISLNLIIYRQLHITVRILNDDIIRESIMLDYRSSGTYKWKSIKIPLPDTSLNICNWIIKNLKNNLKYIVRATYRLKHETIERCTKNYSFPSLISNISHKVNPITHQQPQSKSETENINSVKSSIPETEIHNNIPETEEHNKIPETEEHNKIPETEEYDDSLTAAQLRMLNVRSRRNSRLKTDCDILVELNTPDESICSINSQLNLKLRLLNENIITDSVMIEYRSSNHGAWNIKTPTFLHNSNIESSNPPEIQSESNVQIQNLRCDTRYVIRINYKLNHETIDRRTNDFEFSTLGPKNSSSMSFHKPSTRKQTVQTDHQDQNQYKRQLFELTNKITEMERSHQLLKFEHDKLASLLLKK
ncbi:MAG: hypothetical protein Gaeavirus1_3 [Gaeavirus sp.]|uniref:Uncharacterized protein n=1 Tax=Gaeavirus sp. TaxID=2487767 RepID=A0A3G4ZY70_9VIRU|nr:MAG: hypothetical protein Gaeavirus1_3 [Gaeavirus sp.]